MNYRYRMIQVSCTDCPKRFYRVFYVRENLSLNQIGALIVGYFQGMFEHMWLWRSQNHRYQDKTWLEDFTLEGDLDYDQYTLSTCELNASSKITFAYDTGDGWEFTVKVYKKTMIREFDPKNRDVFIPWGILVEGQGQSIWEDYRLAFQTFLIKGKLIKKYGTPWSVEHPEMFDDPLNIEQLDDAANNAAMNAFEDDDLSRN